MNLSIFQKPVGFLHDDDVIQKVVRRVLKVEAATSLNNQKQNPGWFLTLFFFFYIFSISKNLKCS